MGSSFYDQAALFLEVCYELNIPELSIKNLILIFLSICSSFIYLSPKKKKDGMTFKTLACTVWKSYAKYLEELGLYKAVRYYEGKAQSIEEELQNL